MKKNILLYACAALMLCGSCSDFLDTYPYDALSPATTWETEDDAEKFLVGCYDGWMRGEDFVEWDNQSDIGYNFHAHEGNQQIGNGTLSASNPGNSVYSYTRIRRCITLLDNIDKVTFSDESKKKDIIAQAKTIRAYDYFKMNFRYGGVPIIDAYTSADEAKVPRKSEEEVKKYIYDELDAAISGFNDEAKARGYVTKGTALAVKMRSALYWGDYQRALDAAKAIKDLNIYKLENSYAKLFTLDGRDSKEIILSVQHLKPNKVEWIITLLNNGEGGWGSNVPTQNLIDMYEMADGKTKEESSDYDPKYPFYNRDPRMAMTVLYPGQNWKGGVLNTLDKKLIVTENGKTDTINNPDYPTAADNSSKTCLTWAKYVVPLEQYGGDYENTNMCQIVFRYAEVLLTIAEASNELSGPFDEVYDALDEVRKRANMPEVDRAKYGTKEALRELIRRERTVELAGEGHRRADILRWKDAAGKMLAETVLNGSLTRIVGTIDDSATEEGKRAAIDPDQTEVIETRIFKPHMRYLPIRQSDMDKNPQLVQNSGY
ncbi:MAG: RagB/SusD family nutrient uptake outer membrane protein [Prevotellaceae bacterium]|jgi:hypothetical protein|nr:RagB/SusD family nutrient uptake outer membrane protein [Prevotellaceae bacterium]